MFLLSACSTVSRIEEGKYAILCSGVFSVESCQEQAVDYCPDGYTIISVDDKWSFYTGSMNKVFVNCKSNRIPASVSSKKILNCSEKEIDLKLAEERGFSVEKKGDQYFLVKGDKSVLLSEDKKHLCR